MGKVERKGYDCPIKKRECPKMAKPTTRENNILTPVIGKGGRIIIASRGQTQNHI